MCVVMRAELCGLDGDTFWGKGVGACKCFGAEDTHDDLATQVIDSPSSSDMGTLHVRLEVDH